MNRQHCLALIMACAVISVAAASPTVGLAGQTAPGNVNVPTGAVGLGSVELPRQVMADGRALASGTYDLRVTADSAIPDAPGQLAVLERWVEFRQGDEVKGREVVSIVPQSEIDSVAKSAPPGSGTARVELLKDNEYLRVWVNQSNTHYFIHLVVGYRTPRRSATSRANRPYRRRACRQPSAAPRLQASVLGLQVLFEESSVETA